ncbi:MAG: 4-hydroxybenzoate decarboxylase [Planctomycetes bacterium]|nr:4-hydroxybenzoate decarboxylase [Planctomycetota bacterium]
MHRNLANYLEELRRADDLVEIDAPVDPHLEVAEIHRRVIAAEGPALLFRNPIGSRFPIVMNLFGTDRRVQIGFGDHGQQFLQRLVQLAETMVPPTLTKIWDARDVAKTLLRSGMRNRSSGAVLDVQDSQTTLDDLPITTSWSGDGGPFITLPLIYTEHPKDGRHNLGIYRLQKHDPDHLGLHFQIHKGSGYHLMEAERTGQEFPVTCFLGGPPALIASAVAPLPENVGELMLASLLQGSPLKMTRTENVAHPLIAECDFAIHGTALAGQRWPEGPFGDHYGYYSLQHDYPVMKISSISHRRDAIFPATVVGKPRQEDFFLGDFLQQLLSPLFPLVMPTVKQLWSYGETGYHSLAAAVVKDRYPREAMVSAFRILGEGQLSLTKFLLLTDGAVDLRDFRATLEHVLARADFSRDLHVISCTSMDTLDYTGPEVNAGSKGFLLGLGDPIRDLPGEFTGELASGFDGAEVFCRGCLVVEGPGYEQEPEAASRLLSCESLKDWPLVVIVDDAAEATRTAARFLWTTFTRFEPAADLHAASREVIRNHVSHRAPVAIDARLKPGYPDELFCDQETADLVENRWNEYFPTRSVEMGESDSAHLDLR